VLETTGFHTLEATWNVIAQIGGRFRAADRFAFGPYVAVSLPSPHQPYLEFGLQGTFDLL
jgi:hypothetical protein